MQSTPIVTCFYILTKCFTFEHSPTMNNIPTTLYQPIIIDGLHREIDLYDLGILRDHDKTFFGVYTRKQNTKSQHNTRIKSAYLFGI